MAFESAKPNLRAKSESLPWRHNEHDGVSNHQSHGCLLKRLFRRRSKKTLKLRVTGLCAGNLPVTGEFPAQRASNAENVSIWWRHHVWRYFLWSFVAIVCVCGGVWTPYPRGWTPPPYPRPIFPLYPGPLFSLFLIRYHRPKFRFFAPPPAPPPIWPRPPPIFRQKPPYHRPTNPRALVPPVLPHTIESYFTCSERNKGESVLE